MIMKELDTDSGDIILTKGKTIGYLSQHQDLSSGNTILEELKTAKADIIEMEKQIRTIEMELKHLHGEDLENRLQTYHRLTERFEHADGYAYQSELVGVLKGLGFREDEFSKEVDTLSGGQRPVCPSESFFLPNQIFYCSMNRQPFGYELHLMARDLFAQL